MRDMIGRVRLLGFMGYNNLGVKWGVSYGRCGVCNGKFWVCKRGTIRPVSYFWSKNGHFSENRGRESYYFDPFFGFWGVLGYVFRGKS